MTTTTSLADEVIRTGLPIAAFAVSCLSLWFTRRLWVQSNRPVVTAEVRTHTGGNQAIAYDIAVINSGTRPATNVQLKASPTHIERALSMKARETPELIPDIKDVQRVFSLQGVIPLLLNGQTVTNAFGHTGDEAGDGSLWNPQSTIPIDISYGDLEGRQFTSHLTLAIRDTAGFAGSFWSKAQ